MRGSGPITRTSPAGNPAASSRSATARAAAGVPPAESLVLIRISSSKISRSSRRAAGSFPCWAPAVVVEIPGSTANSAARAMREARPMAPDAVEGREKSNGGTSSRGPPVTARAIGRSNLALDQDQEPVLTPEPVGRADLERALDTALRVQRNVAVGDVLVRDQLVLLVRIRELDLGHGPAVH